MELYIIGILILLFMNWWSIRKLYSKAEGNSLIISLILLHLKNKGEVNICVKDGKIRIESMDKKGDLKND